MLASDTKMTNNCDKHFINNNSYPTAHIIGQSLRDENSNCDGGGAIFNMAITERVTTTATDNYCNDQTAEEAMISCSNRPRLLKTQSSGCDSSLMSCCSGDESEDDDIERAFEQEDDREPDNEIFYDSTNESEDLEGENTSEEQDADEAPNNNVADDCGLSKLYLNDIEIVDQEEEQTVTELVNVAEQDKLMKA